MQKFESTLHFSNSFVLTQSVMLMGSAAGIFYLDLPWFMTLALLSGLLAYVIRNGFIFNQWQRIGQDVHGGWYLKKGDQIFPLDPLGESTLTRTVSILRFKQPEKALKQTCLIFRDSMPHGAYRQFVVRMRYFKKNREKHPEIR